MNIFFEMEVEKTVAVLQSGGVILYPTDTVWGLGCDATNAEAVQKIYAVKNRADTKSVIILLADERDLLHYVAAPDPAVFDYIEKEEKPTTIIFENAINLPESLVAADGSIAIRIVKEPFCKHLIKRLRNPIVSTSANKSGSLTPLFFDAITEDIKRSVDYVVQWRQDETTPAHPSRIIKWNRDGTTTVLRP